MRRARRARPGGQAAVPERREQKKAPCMCRAPWAIMAERKGLEPSASGVTGRRYNRLNYRSRYGVGKVSRILLKKSAPFAQCAFLAIMAERKGLEPSASGVTGRRYNRLNYRSVVVDSTGLEPVTPAV